MNGQRSIRTRGAPDVKSNRPRTTDGFRSLPWGRRPRSSGQEALLASLRSREELLRHPNKTAIDVHNDVQAITFDVGNTLIGCWPSVGAIYAEVAASNGWPGLPAAKLNRRFAAAWRSLKRFRHTRGQWAALVDATFGPLVHPPPSRTFFPQLFKRFAEPDAWQLFEDVVPALETLRELGVKLGVISNWDHRLRPLLRSLNLQDYFEVIVISCEVGSAKPARRIFEIAARRLGVPAAAILHVGDSPQMDITGARRAGLQALRIRRDLARATAGTIRSLGELCPPGSLAGGYNNDPTK